MLRPPTPTDRPRLLEIAVATGLFAASDAESLLGSTLDALFAGTLGDGHEVVVAEGDAGACVGWAYVAPDAFAPDAWNLWWIGVDPPQHGGGAAHALLTHAERTAAARGARLLIIETNDQPALARARAFYARRGYGERGRVPDFYADGEAKVIFSRRIAGETP